ncbi:disease resistance protein ADR1-like isoform X2 [Neltuma alba]|uniref:disease resistance protein ADR1-like isoform X2 n=1 Tax=Neltuma alba TaxID=207710 RepID=UPI0010A47F77|nr:disease resistance protein ADR1-like isoform X2 [Prosopis alba]
MASSLVIELVKQAWKIVEEGLKHERTAQDLGKTGDEVSPMFAEIVELAKRLDLPARQIESLQDIMKQMGEAHLKYSKIQCWDCCCAPCYKAELDKADKAIKDFISYRLSLQTAWATMEILCHIETTTSDQASSHRKPAFKIDRETLIFPELPIEGLNSLLMQNLRSCLLKDDGDKVFNLTGFAGSGKTTLAIQLCVDQQIQGFFNGNVHFKSVGPKIESSGEQLASELRERKGLLVLDNVEPGSEDLVEQCWKQIPSDSKILVISRVVLPGLGSPVAMTPLGEEDAVILLRHFVRPIGTASCNLPDRRILLQVVECCGGSPMAIKMIGRDLRGKPSEFWRQYLRKWSPSQGLSILDTHKKFFDHLHQSLQDSEEYKAISDFFMDLCLFPRYQIIPVSALLDMWVELYNQDEDGIDAMNVVHSLTAMNLADRVVQTREGGSSSDAEDDVDNQFLTQHSILRDLASRYSKEQAGEFERKRLIIETNGNDIPRSECFPQQPLRGIDAFLSVLKASILQRRVAARILSITPGCRKSLKK